MSVNGKPDASGRRKSEAGDDTGAAAIDPRMLQLLVCPQTHGLLEFDAGAQELISRKAKLAFPVRSGLPVLLVSEARALDD